MALIGAVYKWRLDCDSYVYITDTNGSEALIITNECIDENTIKDIVATWSEKTYCERFTEMVNYVHSFEKWKDLRFLDCNVYLKEYYGCDEMLRPAFPTGIQLNLSATSVEYYAQPEATVLDVKCITRDGEKITAYDINFGIPKGIPGLTLKGVIHDLSDLDVIENTQHNDINDGYLLEPLYDDTEYLVNEQKGALYVYRGPGYIFPDTSIRVGSFEYISNLRGPRGRDGEGQYRYDEDKFSYMFGEGDTASGLYSFTKGLRTQAYGERSTAEGYETVAEGRSAHAEGQSTVASDTGSHAEGRNTEASGNASHAEGNYTTASGKQSHAEGSGREDYRSTASGDYSHVEGYMTNATNIGSHAEGGSSNASGKYSHAEGGYTFAEGNYSHSEGLLTHAFGNYSHAEGVGNVATNVGQHVSGTYATIDDTGDFIFQIGVGISEDERQDAFVVLKDGTVIIYAMEAEIGDVDMPDITIPDLSEIEEPIETEDPNDL